MFSTVFFIVLTLVALVLYEYAVQTRRAGLKNFAIMLLGFAAVVAVYLLLQTPVGHD